MKRELSQEEIDALFQDASGQGVNAGLATIPYDFRKADRISKSQLRAMHTLHEIFVRNLVSSLSVYLRSYLSGSLASVEELAYGEFLEGLPSPTCAISLTMEPVDGNSMIQMDSALVLPILDILAGGKGKPTNKGDRELTRIEQKLLDAVFRIVAQNLSDSWKIVVPIEFKIRSMETEPQLLRLLAPGETVVAMGFEMRIGDGVGMLNLVVPTVTVKSMSEKFEQNWTGQGPRSGQLEQSRMLQLARRALLDLNAELSGATMRVEDMMNLKQGDVIRFNHPVEKSIYLAVNGKAKFKGQVRQMGSNQVFEIEEPMQETPSPVAEEEAR